MDSSAKPPYFISSDLKHGTSAAVVREISRQILATDSSVWGFSLSSKVWKRSPFISLLAVSLSWAARHYHLESPDQIIKQITTSHEESDKDLPSLNLKPTLMDLTTSAIIKLKTSLLSCVHGSPQSRPFPSWWRRFNIDHTEGPLLWLQPSVTNEPINRALQPRVRRGAETLWRSLCRFGTVPSGSSVLCESFLSVKAGV